MVRNLRRLFFISFIGLVLPLASAWAQQKSPQYLSFEERWVFSYLLAGVGEPASVSQDYFRRLVHQLKSQAEMPQQVIKVSSFDEFLTAFRGEWPNSESLQRDIELLEAQGLRRLPSKYKASNSDLQRQIDGFLRRHEVFVQENVEQRMNMDFGFRDLLDPAKFGMIMQQQNSALTMKSTLLAGTQRLSDWTCDVLQDDFRQVSQLSKNISGTLQGSEVFNALMSKILGGYFENLGIKSKKQIVSQLMGENLRASSMERFDTMVMNSGPQFQKLLQLVAREAGVGDELLVVFKKLESKTRAVPPAIVKQIIDAEKDEYQIVDYELVPLGIGTMAQVHRGNMRLPDGSILPVVIRFLKPGMEERIEEDREILAKIAPEVDKDPAIIRAGMPKLEPLVDDLTQTVRDELKLRETVTRQNRGHDVYSREKRIRLDGSGFRLVIYVPKVYDNGGPSNLMVQELISGAKLDKLQDQLKLNYPNFKRPVVEAIAKMWMSELLFNSGFFHSDLHQGNFLVQIDGEMRKIHVNILDFGMGGELSEFQRRGILLLAAGAQIDDADMISEAVWTLSDQDLNHITRDEFDSLVKAKIVDVKARHVMMSPTGVFAWAMEQGIKFSHTVLSVNRGFSILEGMLLDAGSDMDTDKLGQVVAMENVWKLKSELRQTGAVKYTDLVRLWFSTFKKARDKDLPVRMCRIVLLK